MNRFANNHRSGVRYPLTVFIWLFSFLSLSCNGLRVYVNDTVPPEFSLNAGRFAECCTNFDQFIVFEEGSDQPLWKITVKEATVDLREANSLVIRYGKVPERFLQEFPTAGEPEALCEGKSYLAVAGASSYVPWARTRFTIKSGKALRLAVDSRDLP